MTEKLRIGILGADWAAAGHATAYSQVPALEVAALWSRSRQRAETLAGQINQPGLRVYDHWQNLIEQSKVDLISIATPPLLRREPVLLALARGCHVLVEKPISVGVAEAQAMVTAAQVAKTVTATCFNWRYAPAYQVAWRAVQEGQIGQIRDMRTEWRVRMLTRDFFVARPQTPRLDISNGSRGEALSHDLDKAHFLTGAEFMRIVSRIGSLTIKQDGDFLVEGAQSMHLAELTAGILAAFRLTVTAGQGDWQFVLSGDEGTLILDAGATVTRQRAMDDQPMALTIPESEQVPAGVELMQHTWNRLIADFVQAVRQGDIAHQSAPHLPTLDDGLRNEAIIAAARASETERRWVEVDNHSM